MSRRNGLPRDAEVGMLRTDLEECQCEYSELDKVLRVDFLSRVLGSGSLVSRVPPGGYSEPLAFLNQSYRFAPGTVSKQKYCPSGGEATKWGCSFFICHKSRILHTHIRKKATCLGGQKSAQTTKEAVLSSPGPSLPGCIELTFFEALVIPGGQENAVESLRREESNKGNILYSFLITKGRT